MRYASIIGRAAIVALCLALGAGTPVFAEQEQSGRQLYLRYCGTCHGPQGKGDGVASSFMRPSPPDLTRLADRNGGTFSVDAVAKAIDGREMPRVHGDPFMPVWGTVLREDPAKPGAPKVGGNQYADDTIRAIAEYLKTIQVP